MLYQQGMVVTKDGGRDNVERWWRCTEREKNGGGAKLAKEEEKRKRD